MKGRRNSEEKEIVRALFVLSCFVNVSPLGVVMSGRRRSYNHLTQVLQTGKRQSVFDRAAVIVNEMLRFLLSMISSRSLEVITDKVVLRCIVLVSQRHTEINCLYYGNSGHVVIFARVTMDPSATAATFLMGEGSLKR